MTALQQAEQLLLEMSSTEKIQLLQLIARDLGGEPLALNVHRVYAAAIRELREHGSRCGRLSNIERLVQRRRIYCEHIQLCEPKI